MTKDERQDELFAQYWEALAENPAAPPPPGLAPLAAQRARQMQPPDPRAEFVARLEQRLRALPAPNVQPNDQAAPLLRSGLPVRTVRRPSRQIAPLFAMAVMLLVLAVGAALLAGMLAGRSRQLTEGTGPPNGNNAELSDAHDILQRAEQALKSGTAKSYIVTETLTYPQPHTIKTWFQAPNRWRVETITTTAKPGGDKANPQYSMQVSDGANIWKYDPNSKVIWVNITQNLVGVPSDPLHPDEGIASDSYRTVINASDCFTPKLQDTESIAGRQAYVIALTGWHCPGTIATAPPGEVLWIDQQTFFVLGRASTYGNGQMRPGDQVISIQYDAAIDPTTFTFTPPADATVLDYRPQSAPSASEFQNLIATMAKSLDYPIFLPQYLPDGLVPLYPMPVTQYGLTLEYAPPAEANKPSSQPGAPPTAAPMGAPSGGIQIFQNKVSYDLLARMPGDSTFKPIEINGEPAWLRSMPPTASQMLAVDSTLLFVHQGTYISLDSHTYSGDELLKVAASLAPAPGSHAPLPNPTLTGLLRQQASFPVFLPAYVPTGLTAEPPSASPAMMEVNYHNSAGEIAFTLRSGQLTKQMPSKAENSYTRTAQPMTLPNGLTAYFEAAECNHGQASLYWQQDGEFVTLVSVPTRKESAGLSKEEMVKIAASLSKTADLGKIEPAPANRQPDLPFPEATAATCPTPALPLPDAQPTGIP